MTPNQGLDVMVPAHLDADGHPSLTLVSEDIGAPKRGNGERNRWCLGSASTLLGGRYCFEAPPGKCATFAGPTWPRGVIVTLKNAGLSHLLQNGKPVLRLTDHIPGGHGIE